MAMPLFCLPLSHFSDIIRISKVGFWRAIWFFPECHRAGTKKSQLWAMWRRHAQGHHAKGNHCQQWQRRVLRVWGRDWENKGEKEIGNRQTKWGNRQVEEKESEQLEVSVGQTEKRTKALSPSWKDYTGSYLHKTTKASINAVRLSQHFIIGIKLPQGLSLK